jgi:hypothetical protein
MTRDATGCYPLFSCRDWSQLGIDLKSLRSEGLISLTLVTDPLGDFRSTDLERWFHPVARPYKNHYLVDLSIPPERAVASHHRRNARRFLRHAWIEPCAWPGEHLAVWCRLYDELVVRHGITGPARFSRTSFAHQLSVPGVVLLRAVASDGETLGMQIWYQEPDRAWHHLSAYSAEGYRHGGASYGLLWFAREFFAQRGVRWLNLGSGAGLGHDPRDGLSCFKKGWATTTRTAWLCGAVLDPQRYADMVLRRPGPPPGNYFPAYRAPAGPDTAVIVAGARRT